jgi:hypothetical protein
MIFRDRMLTISHQRNPHPQTMPERDAVLAELRSILLSVHFRNSKRYPALLQYVVEHTLAGKAELLKERTIGVEVFDRPATYDTSADTVVRFTAGEVRKRLAAYYHDVGQTSGLRISLPPGSYVPEFFYGSSPEASLEQDAHVEPERNGIPGQLEQLDPISNSGPHDIELVANPELAQASAQPKPATRRFVIWAVVTIALVVAFATWKAWPVHPESSLDSFWRPVLRDRSTILLCAGGNVFAPSPIPSFVTADKGTAYPYFSLQTATSVTQLSSFIQRNGATAEFESAASTPLPELHSHPIILLNAYNNQWTLRLVEHLRFHFSLDTGSVTEHSIVDGASSGVRWKRDLSIPYSDTDDYALMARFWDTTTDNWVLVLAGLGRNGTEAASQFVTSPHYMQQLRDRLGKDLANRNIEAVLKVTVIDGKTGPPSIVATQVW